MGTISGRYRIGKSFAFEAAHCLPGLSQGHKCARLHGHSYRVEPIVEAESLVPPGFVTDFGDLAAFKRYLDAELDHRVLNDVLSVEPTSENLARHLAEWFVAEVEPGIPGRLGAARVSETASS
ncbi:6-pyruvoyl tetrahydropterin synthase family protein [Streptomyces sp. NPDC058423]|uniref:6-pyruvoyl trahydropterin synthase family protein n=1 Tax=unclassified Streptomyces TaxID=2593676 RepID=UPI00365D18DB